MIEYIVLAVLVYLTYKIYSFGRKIDELSAHQVKVYLSVVPMGDDKPVYNTHTTLIKQLNLSVPPIVGAVIAEAGSYPAMVSRIKHLEGYVSCDAKCEVEQDSYENCVALFKELGWVCL